jgi:hypothetical protein
LRPEDCQEIARHHLGGQRRDEANSSDFGVLEGNSPGAEHPTKLLDGLTSTMERPVSSRAHPRFLPHTGGAKTHGDFRDDYLS